MRRDADLRAAAERIADTGAPHAGPTAPGGDPRVAQLALIAAAAGAQRSRLRRWGRLEVIELLGEGGFGCVYRARDPVLDRQVALKLLKRDCAHPPDCDALIREARLLARVSHPNVITVYGADRIGDEVGVWMELVEGGTLETLAGSASRDPVFVTAIGVALCDALTAVHAMGLVHGDVKPSNVLLGDNGRVLLSDFGTGRWTHLGHAARAATPRYAAPEVLAGDPTTPSADIYSLGVLLREIAPPSQPALIKAVERATASEPADRFASAAEFRDALLDTLPLAPPPPPRRSLATLALLGAAIAALLSGAWIAAGGRDPAPAVVEAPASARALRIALLRGRQEWNKRTREGSQSALRHFNEALARDPECGEAWAGLAQTYVLMSAYGHVRQDEALPRAVAAAKRALAIDPRRSDAHTALGYAAVQSNRVAEGIAHYRTAMALDPGNATAHHWYALTVLRTRPDDAVVAAERAFRLDPLSPAISTDLAHIYVATGRAARAERHLKRVVTMFPDYVEAELQLAIVLRTQGDLAGAMRYVRSALHKAPLHPGAIIEYAKLSDLAGRDDLIREMLAKLHQEARQTYLPPLVFAMLNLYLENPKETARWIRAGLEEKAEWTIGLERHPEFARLREAPEVKAAIGCLGC